MSQVQYVISPYPTLLQNMVVKVWENTNLDEGAEVQTIVIPEKNGAGVVTPGAGHQVQNVLVITALDRVPHTIILRTLSGTQLHKFTFEPTEDVITYYAPIYFRIGDGGANTPAVGTSQYVNGNLAGITNFQATIHRNGGLMYPGVHFDMDPAGGFGFLAVGDVFEDLGEYLIQIVPQPVARPVNDSVVGKQWGATSSGGANMHVDVTTNVNYGPEHLRKLIRLSGAGQFHFTVAPPPGYPFRFINMVAGNPKIYFDVANLIQPGGDVDEITLPTGGIIEVVYDGAKFNMTINNTDSIGNMPYAAITHIDTVDVGNISFNQSFTIGIPNQGTAAYLVVGSFRSKAGAATPQKVLDCTLIHSIDVQTVDSFTVRVREEVGVNQNSLFHFAIMKIN